MTRARSPIRALSSMTPEEMTEMAYQAQNAMIRYADRRGFSGLSCAGEWNFYRAVEDAIEAEWLKAVRATTWTA